MGVGVHLLIFLQLYLPYQNKLYVIKSRYMRQYANKVKISSVNSPKVGRNYRIILSKILLNLVIDHVCTMLKDFCTGCLKYLFQSLVSVLLEDI